MKNLERYKRSIKSEALSSVLLLICTISALCIANSSYEGIYNKIIFDNLFFIPLIVIETLWKGR